MVAIAKEKWRCQGYRESRIGAKKIVGLVVLLLVVAAVVPHIAAAGWVTRTIGVIIWIAALVVCIRAISWAATVYAEEIAPRTKSDLDSPFLVRTVRNLVMVLFLFVIVGGIATTINEGFNYSFFTGGVGLPSERLRLSRGPS